MNNFSDSDEIKELARQRRARQVALAILNRAKEAGIPDKYIRIKEEEFVGLLSKEFHSNPSFFTNMIYHNMEKMLKREFVLIDGGNFESRQRAGFAVMFRLIAYDKIGIYQNCNSLVHRFQSINGNGEMTRNELVDELKSYDILFIGEVDRSTFVPHFESASFFDELLSYRIDNSKITIISFTRPMADSGVSPEKLAQTGKLKEDCGKHLSRLDLVGKSTDTILRIRVKPI